MAEIKYHKLNYFKTKVPVSKSQSDIEKILNKFGLQGTRFTKYKGVGIIEFILFKNENEIMFRFKYNLPEDERIKRQVYRALFYYLKNRFLAVQFGISTIEEEFMQETVLKLPDGTVGTIKEIVGDKIAKLQYNDLRILEEKEAETK